MNEKLSAFLIKTLTTRIAPMVYIMMGVSVFIGFCFSTGVLVGNGESILFASGAIINSSTWGLWLFIGSGLALFGLARQWSWAIKQGSFACLILYIMACFQLVINHHWYGLVVFGMFHLLFQGYVYLSESLGVLEREALTNREQ